MERFGSSRLRIVWACVCLLLTGLVLGGIHASTGDAGFTVRAFGFEIPAGVFNGIANLTDPMDMVRGAIINGLYAAVPALMLLTGFIHMVDMVQEQRLRGLALAPGLAALHGLFFSQTLILPLWALSFRLMGSFFPGPVVLADLNAVLLGLQLLLWALVLCLLIKSNRGIALVLTLGLKTLGSYLAWGGEFLGNPDLFSVPAFLVKTMAFLGKLLPTGQVPSDPLAWTALPLSLGGPLLIAFLLLLVPGGKKPKTTRRAKG